MLTTILRSLVNKLNNTSSSTEIHWETLLLTFLHGGNCPFISTFALLISLQKTRLLFLSKAYSLLCLVILTLEYLAQTILGLLLSYLPYSFWTPPRLPPPLLFSMFHSSSNELLCSTCLSVYPYLWRRCLAEQC